MDLEEVQQRQRACFSNGITCPHDSRISVSLHLRNYEIPSTSIMRHGELSWESTLWYPQPS